MDGAIGAGWYLASAALQLVFFFKFKTGVRYACLGTASIFAAMAVAKYYGA